MSQVKDNFEALVIYKAGRMSKRPRYQPYSEDLIKYFNAKTLEQAFLLGAYDSMAYEMASTIGQAYMKPSFRKNLIKEILKQFPLP